LVAAPQKKFRSSISGFGSLPGISLLSATAGNFAGAAGGVSETGLSRTSTSEGTAVDAMSRALCLAIRTGECARSGTSPELPISEPAPNSPKRRRKTQNTRGSNSSSRFSVSQSSQKRRLVQKCHSILSIFSPQLQQKFGL
jgi:hypothetical protein